MKNTSACNFHDDEDIDQLESCHHNDKEISGNDCLSVVMHERHPALRWVGRMLGCFGHVAPNGARRNSDSDFQQQFVGKRSSPQVGLFVAISAISLCKCSGTRGRPRDRDFHFQNRRKPLRCQRINVSGLTIVRASRQSNRRESRANVKRLGSVASRGFTFRSTKSRLRRNRFSAATTVVGLETQLYKGQCIQKKAKKVRIMCRNDDMNRFY